MSDDKTEPRSELEQPIWAVVTSRDDVKMTGLTYESAIEFAEQGVRENHAGVAITTAEAAARVEMFKPVFGWPVRELAALYRSRKKYEHSSKTI